MGGLRGGCGLIKVYTVQDIEKYWAECWPLIESGLQDNDGVLNEADILGLLNRQLMQLWVVEDEELLASFVTEVIWYPRDKYIRIVALGGKGMNRWVPELLNSVKAAGRSIGARGVEIFGRAGWMKVLKSEGFEGQLACLLRQHG